MINRESMGISMRYCELIGIKGNQNWTKESRGVNGNQKELIGFKRSQWESVGDIGNL